MGKGVLSFKMPFVEIKDQESIGQWHNIEKNCRRLRIHGMDTNCYKGCSVQKDNYAQVDNGGFPRLVPADPAGVVMKVVKQVVVRVEHGGLIIMLLHTWDHCY